MCECETKKHVTATGIFCHVFAVIRSFLISCAVKYMVFELNYRSVCLTNTYKDWRVKDTRRERERKRDAKDTNRGRKLKIKVDDLQGLIAYAKNPFLVCVCVCRSGKVKSTHASCVVKIVLIETEQHQLVFRGTCILFFLF